MPPTTDGADERIALLARTVLCSPLPVAALVALASELQRVTLAKGEVLFEAGSRGSDVFFVRSGLLQVVDSTASGGRVLSEVGRHEHVGEMAALTGEPRAAAVVAAVASILYTLPGATLRRLLDEHPVLYARLSRGLMRQLQRQGRSQPRGVRTCGLVGAGAAAASTRAQVLRLAHEIAIVAAERVIVLDCTAPGATQATSLPPGLADITQTVGRLIAPVSPDAPSIATSAGVDDRVVVLELGREVAADAPLVDLVAELQRRSDRLLVYATLPWPAAAAQAVSQCDTLLWLVREGDPTAAPACERAARDLPAPPRHPAPRAFPLPPTDDGPALRKLARTLAGRRTALVLGAGGAKGLAHVGALRAFERHRIEFDAVAGTSIGAIVGALLAMGWSAAAIETMLIGVAAKPWRTLFDVRMPTEAFFRSRKKTELIALHCGERRIEDLRLPFFATAGDLVSLAPVVFRSGPLALALDASSAIPTVFRPVRNGPQLLVDGWVCDPLPAGIVHDEGYERVIAVDLSPRLGAAAGGTARPALRGGLGGRFRIVAIAMRAMELASREHVTRTLPLIDVLVRPDLDEFGGTDLDAAAEIAERGEQAVEAALPALTSPEA